MLRTGILSKHHANCLAVSISKYLNKVNVYVVGGNCKQHSQRIYLVYIFYINVCLGNFQQAHTKCYDIIFLLAMKFINSSYRERLFFIGSSIAVAWINTIGLFLVGNAIANKL